ncbi:glycosyltransferase [Phormidium sp. CLA17]|uniref:glycosyltransferase n=1 Tax=Leptolyngbya sp. Cla-17 TaxID=2803751 RepID=UPI001492104A|nr:glycosyltransferase [Leptolyngbya sp. Cla-17]MBM0741374.1 glycosyltransferase [Leptolyngbya sp. Cla-17]
MTVSNDMNILFIAFDKIYPIETGAGVAQFGMVEFFSHICNVSLLLSEENILTEVELAELRALLPKTKVYSSKILKPDEPKSAFSNSFQNLLAFYRILKAKIKSACRTLVSRSSEHKDLEENPETFFNEMYSSWNPYQLHSQEYIETIYEIIDKDLINIIQLDFIRNLNLTVVLPSTIKKVFVEHECIFYRIKSHMSAKHITSGFANYILEFYKKVEISLLEQVDGVITFNDSENALLKDALGQQNHSIKFINSPFPVPKQEIKELTKQDVVRPEKLFFVGGEEHYPNKDAVEWFLEEVAEEVFQKLGLSLHVVGKWSAETVAKYQDHSSKVKFLGFVDDIYKVSRNSIGIAPIRIGGGLKSKVLLSMAQGIPVICTSFALEGINANNLESIMIANNKDEFFGAIEYLLSDLEHTFNMCKHAQDLIKKYYSPSVIYEQRYKFYRSILEDKANVER